MSYIVHVQDVEKDSVIRALSKAQVPEFVPKANANIITDESIKTVDKKKV